MLTSSQYKRCRLATCQSVHVNARYCVIPFAAHLNSVPLKGVIQVVRYRFGGVCGEQNKPVLAYLIRNEQHVVDIRCNVRHIYIFFFAFIDKLRKHVNGFPVKYFAAFVHEGELVAARHLLFVVGILVLCVIAWLPVADVVHCRQVRAYLHLRVVSSAAPEPFHMLEL